MRMYALWTGLALSSAQSWAVEHPVFPPTVSATQLAELQARTALVMDLGREEIDEWIVARSSFQMVACPACEWPGGRRDRKDYWRWDPQTPDRVTCTHCGTTFPDGRYPMSAVEAVTDPTGAVQQFPYFPGPDGYRYYLAGKIENHRKRYLEGMVPALASLYVATGEGRYARQAAQILDRLADVYPHYNVQICRREGSPLLIEEIAILQPDEHGLVPVPPSGAGRAGADDGGHYPYWSNRRGDGWNGWFYSEMPTALAYAWDQVAASAEVDRLGAGLGKDVRANIADFLRATANYARSYPPYAGNMDPTLIEGFAVIGRVIGEPEFVHDAVRRVRLILERSFFPDGNWREAAPSYHSQTIAGLTSAVSRPLQGYSDPPGYVGLEDGQHLEDLDLARELPLLGESRAALDALRLPNDSYACIHDTWSPVTTGRALRTPGEGPMASHLHWGMGHATLGVGDQGTGLQAHLHFSGGYGHTHLDTLNLILFAAGRELISDLGYTHSTMRPFAVASAAHNLVLVDGAEQRGAGEDPPADGYLIAAGRLGPTVQYVEAGGEGAYPGRVTLYRRALSVVECPDGSAYVLDLFRVAGGERHDWVLHGSADEDMGAAISLPLEPLPGSLLPPGVESQLWANEYGRNVVGGANLSYGLFRNLECASAEEGWRVRMSCADGTAVETAVAGMADATVIRAELPSVRRAREDSARVLDYWMPAVILRREGPQLRSTFVAVHRPVAGASTPLTVECLTVESDDPFAVAVAVSGPGFTDYHLSSADPAATLTVAALPIAATGRYSFVRTVGGEAVAMGVLDGEALRWGERALAVTPGAAGEMRAIHNAEEGDAEHALVVDAELPERAAIPDERVIVRLANGMTYGLAVRALRREGAATVIALGDRPGLRLAADGGVEMTHWPLRTVGGPLTFRLPGHGWWQAER